MEASKLVPLWALVVVAIGLLIVDVTTATDWSWWAITIALAATFVQIVRPGRRTISTGGRR